MVRDINYSVGKFSRGFNSPLTKAEIMGQPDKPVYHAFTQEYPAKRNRLLTEIELTNPLNNSVVKGIALWDTGATSSCISDSVAGKLDLKPTGMMNIRTPSGSKEVRTFLVNIKLPNYLSVVDVPVCETDIGNQDIDVLIGMDIILLGDFSVSNFNDRTVFSFRHPSKATTDYVKQLKAEDVIGPRHGNGKKKRKQNKK